MVQIQWGTTDPKKTIKEQFKKLSNQLNADFINQMSLNDNIKRVPGHYRLGFLVCTALMLGGLVQQSTTVALLALSNPLSVEEFAEYVANTSFLSQHCNSPDVINNSSTSFINSESNETDSEELEFEIPSAADLKVPLLAEYRAASSLRISFLWGAFLSPMLGWVLCERIGAQRVFGWGILFAGGLSMLVPASWGTVAHIILRVVQGAATGVVWPAIHMLAASWCPPNQRSVFVSLYAGWPLGWGLASLIGTPLVHSFGKDALFYMEAGITFIWFAVYCLLFPSRRKVKFYVAFHTQQNDGTANLHLPKDDSNNTIDSNVPVPWKKLSTSAPVWACIVSVFGSYWGQSILKLAAPKYLRLVYGFAMTQDMVMTVLPNVGLFFTSLTCGLIADHLIFHKTVSNTTIRKIMVYAAHYFPAAIFFIGGYTGCDPTVPAALFCAAALFIGALPSGVFASSLEIAPNFAGVVFALCQTFGALGGLCANYIITEGLHGSLPGSWRLVFGVASIALFISGTFFLFYGRGGEQDWNKSNRENMNENEDDEEAQEAGESHESPLHPSATQMTLVA